GRRRPARRPGWASEPETRHSPGRTWAPPRPKPGISPDYLADLACVRSLRRFRDRKGAASAAFHGCPSDRRRRGDGRRRQGSSRRPANAGRIRRALPAVLGRRAGRAGVLPGRSALGGGRRQCPPRGPRPGRRPHLSGPGRFLARRTTMRTKYLARLGGIAAVIAAALLWLVPARAQPRVFDPPGPGVASAAAADDTAPAPMTAMAARPTLTRQLAQARLATAKYATNLARAKA